MDCYEKTPADRQAFCCCTQQNSKAEMARLTGEICAQTEPTSIFDQASLWLAPDISDMADAIPIPSLVQLLTKLGIGVNPDRQKTQCMIQQSQLCNLSNMIAFTNDHVAGNLWDAERSEAVQVKSDVLWLIRHLPQLTYQEIPGKHLQPIGIQISDLVVDLNPFDKFVQPIAQRRLEPLIPQILEQLPQTEPVP